MYDPKETNDITPFNEIKPIIESNRNKNRHHHHHHDHQQQQQNNNNNYSFSLQKKNLNPPLIENIPQKVLSYSIHDYSSYSAAYHPKHILENKPLDQASRWSSAIHDQNQFITITFPSPVVAKSITLGKFHRAHACNLKEFKIYGGYSKDNMLELLNSGLRNDNEPENFDLRIHRQQMVY
ncbi:Muskelin N-terminus-domain-containing protein, partial [Cunninghamella echinulata]